MKMKKWETAIAAVILVILLLGAIHLFIEFFGLPSLKSRYPKLEIEYDENKNKLAVIIKKDGIYDTPKIREELNTFLLSVKKDVGIDNVGVQRVKTNSLNETDQFIENLYYNKDVGYIIIIGEDVVCKSIDEWRKETPRLFKVVDEKLSVIGEKKLEGPRIALSWILPPFNYLDDDKKDFVSKIITTYTYYHNHPQEILSKFNRSSLVICKPVEYEFMIQMDSPLYSFPWVKISNTDSGKVREEMKKGHLVFYYLVHGWEKEVEFGLDTDGSSTTIEEFLQFVEENGLPGLFVEPGACEHTRPVIATKWWIFPSSDEICCWPQANLWSGVWAYYKITGSSLECESIRRGFSEEPFLGYVVRRYAWDFCNRIYGDITAHMT